ncbi:MAG TPA: hypothetical protein VMV03_05480 [Spirochaetia bacterium]|nr:hypothetical protein [Spirochaetia bacterium]
MVISTSTSVPSMSTWATFCPVRVTVDVFWTWTVVPSGFVIVAE